MGRGSKKRRKKKENSFFQKDGVNRGFLKGVLLCHKRGEEKPRAEQPLRACITLYTYQTQRGSSQIIPLSREGILHAHYAGKTVVLFARKTKKNVGKKEKKKA